MRQCSAWGCMNTLAEGGGLWGQSSFDRHSSHHYPIAILPSSFMQLTIDIYAQQVSRKAALPDGKESLIKPRRTKVIAALLGDWGKEFVTTRGGKRSATVDTLEYCAARARYLKTRIMAEQEACRDRPSPTAFVSFRTREAAAVASQVMLHHDVEYWRAGVAPRPQEARAGKGDVGCDGTVIAWAGMC